MILVEDWAEIRRLLLLMIRAAKTVGLVHAALNIAVLCIVSAASLRTRGIGGTGSP